MSGAKRLKREALCRMMLRQVQRLQKASAYQEQSESTSPELVPCYDGDFNWSEYMDVCGTQPVISEDCFAHVRFMESTVCEAIFQPCTVICARHNPSGAVKIATVESAVVEKLIVRWLGATTSDMETISVYDVLTDEEISGAQQVSALRLNKDYTFPEYTNADKAVVSQKIQDLIQPGQYFEIQDDVEPRRVCVVKVISNRSGVVEYQSGPTVHVVHIANERCHVVGWTDQGVQTGLQYHHDDVKLLPEAKKNPVNRLVFESRLLKPHRMQVGQLVEIVDCYRNGVIFPGFVSSLINSHYYRVTVSTDACLKDYEMVGHRSHPFVLPPGFSRANGLRLSAPVGFSDLGSGKPREFSWHEYRNSLNLQGPVAEDALQHPIVKDCPEAMRHIEVLCYRQNTISSAVVVRIVKHLIWLSFDHYSVLTPSTIYDVQSLHLFPCRFGQENKIRCVFPAKFNTLPPVKDNEGSRFGKDKIFTTAPTPVFTPARRPYLPEHIITKDIWLPRVYVNSTCFHGPFIDPSKLCVLRSSYGPGPLFDIIDTIMKDVIASAYVPQDVFRSYEWAEHTSLPTTYAKKNRRKDRKTDLHKVLHIPRCENARTFAGWMRVFLRILEACPSLFSMEKVRGQCPTMCHLLKKDKYVQPGRYIGCMVRGALQSAAVPVVVAATPTVTVKKDKDAVVKRRSSNKPENGLKRKRASRDATTNGHVKDSNKEKETVTVTEEQKPAPSTVAPRDGPLPIEHLNSCTRIPLITVSDDEDVTILENDSPVKIFARPAEVSSDETSRSQSPKTDARTTTVTPGGSVTSRQSEANQTSGRSPAPTTFASASASVQAVSSTGEPSSKKKEEEGEGEDFVPLQSDPYTWLPGDLCAWLKTVGAEEIGRYLELKDVDGARFISLTLNELLEMSMMLGPAVKAVELISKLKQAYEKQFL